MATRSQKSTASFRTRFFVFFPACLGLACAYAGIPTATAWEFCGTAEGVDTDGAAMVAIGFLLLCVMAVRRMHIKLTPQTAKYAFLSFVLLEFAGVASLGVMRLAGACSPATSFWISVGITIVGVLAVGCWLRDVEGADTITSGVFVFVAMALVAALVLLVDSLPEDVRCWVLAPVVLCQIPLYFWESAKISERETPELIRDDDYRAYLLSGLANKRFLVAGTIGLASTALVSGFLCGFSGEQPVSFGSAALVIRFLLIELICLLFVVAILRGKSRIMTVGLWITVELLAGFALVCYTAFPDSLELGAIIATVIASMMVVIVWHLSLSFMAAGWREPLYYVVVIWGIWALSHGVGRYGLTLLPMHGDSHFTGAVISLLLLVSTQIIMVKLIDVAQYAVKTNALMHLQTEVHTDDADPDTPTAYADDDAAPSALERFLGLDDDSSIPDVRHAVMRRSAEEIGRQFMLSDREIEVLALYVAGFTQKRVAAELHVTTATAHTHISRIYAKTGMHSRQELLDYISEYIDVEETPVR